MAEATLTKDWIAPELWNQHTVRELERTSIRRFMEQHGRYIYGGRVLDFGAGKPETCRTPQPYRDLVHGDYVPYDEGDPWPAGALFDAVICTQVMQYLVDPKVWLGRLFGVLKPGGYLVMTYPTNWDEVEVNDFWRFTKAGMEVLLFQAGFDIVRHERRASIDLGGFRFPLGYGVVAQRPVRGSSEFWGGPPRPTGVISSDSQMRFDPLSRNGTYARLSIDESAGYLTSRLRSRNPFLFVRYGDGALECINRKGIGHTADGEQYSPELARGMQEAWDRLFAWRPDGSGGDAELDYWEKEQGRIFVGDWLSASFGANRSTEYRAEYARLIGGARLNFLHFEALLLTRESCELLDFYRAVKADTRRKVYIGPKEHAAAARMLGCEHVVTPMKDLLASVDSIYEKLANDPFGFDILLWAAGMAGTIPVVKLWEKFPGRTYINLGSAMDPLNPPLLDGKTRAYTRSGQLTKARALEFFRELL